MEGQRADDSALDAQVRFDRGDWENPAASLKFMQQKAFEWLFFFFFFNQRLSYGVRKVTSSGQLVTHTYLPACLIPASGVDKNSSGNWGDSSAQGLAPRR